MAFLGVCFGPTLLRPKDETVATIMDIKFYNVVVEMLIANCEQVCCFFLCESKCDDLKFLSEHRCWIHFSSPIIDLNLCTLLSQVFGTKAPHQIGSLCPPKPEHTLGFCCFYLINCFNSTHNGEFTVDVVPAESTRL